MADNQVDKIVEMLIKSTLTSYFIAKKTGLTEQTLSNYRNKKTIPTAANAKLLEYFFEEINANNGAKNSGNISNSTINSDHRQYYSDSPDVLRSQIEELEKMVAEKEVRIKEKDSQIKEKDSQIKALLSILGGAEKA